MSRTFSVGSARAGFIRCGRAWPSEPVEVGEDEFTAEEWERIRATPMLTVVQADSGPRTAADRENAIAAGIANLDRDNEAHWTKSGKPALDVLRELTGLRTSPPPSGTPPRQLPG